jgi:hypothetical protein
MLIELVLGLVLQEKAPAKDGGGQGPMLQVAEVDTNGDGWISAAELKAALAKLGGGGEKDGVKKPGGEKDGFKKPGGEGDGVKKPFKGEGDAPVKKPGVKDGEGAKKPGPKDGEAPVKKGPKDGEGERKEGEKDQK